MFLQYINNTCNRKMSLPKIGDDAGAVGRGDGRSKGSGIDPVCTKETVDLRRITENLRKFLNIRQNRERSHFIQGFHRYPRANTDESEVIVVDIDSGKRDLAIQIVEEFITQNNTVCSLDDFEFTEQTTKPDFSMWRENVIIQIPPIPLHKAKIGCIAISKTPDMVNFRRVALTCCHVLTRSAVVKEPQSVLVHLPDHNHSTKLDFLGVCGFFAVQPEEDLDDKDKSAVDIAIIDVTNKTEVDLPLQVNHLFDGNILDLKNTFHLNAPVFKRASFQSTGLVHVYDRTGSFHGGRLCGEIMLVKPQIGAQFSTEGDSGALVEIGDRMLVGYIVGLQKDYVIRTERTNITWVLYMHSGLKALEKYCKSAIRIKEDPP